MAEADVEVLLLTHITNDAELVLEPDLYSQMMLLQYLKDFSFCELIHAVVAAVNLFSSRHSNK